MRNWSLRLRAGVFSFAKLSFSEALFQLQTCGLFAQFDDGRILNLHKYSRKLSGQTNIFAAGKQKICNRQVRRWPSAKFMSDKRQNKILPLANFYFLNGKPVSRRQMRIHICGSPRTAGLLSGLESPRGTRKENKSRVQRSRRCPAETCASLDNCF